MLTLTDNADAIATTIVTRQDDSSDAGLRIQAAPDAGPSGQARFTVQVVDAPEPADEILQGSSTRVFLDRTAAEALSDMVLDAGVDDDGAVSFSILPQPL